MAFIPIGAELGPDFSLPFRPYYPVANLGTFENAHQYANRYAGYPEGSQVQVQAQEAQSYLASLDGGPTHDYFRDALKDVIGVDPGVDPDGDGWEPSEISQRYGHPVERQARNKMFVDHPELFPIQTSQGYLDWVGGHNG